MCATIAAAAAAAAARHLTASEDPAARAAAPRRVEVATKAPSLQIGSDVEDLFPRNFVLQGAS